MVDRIQATVVLIILHIRGFGVWDLGFGILGIWGFRGPGLLAFWVSWVSWVHKVHRVRKNILFVYVRYPKYAVVLSVSFSYFRYIEIQ